MKKNMRYGNLVMHQGLPCKVIIIGDGGIGIMDKAGKTTVLPEEKLQPVPVTGDVLKKIGFAEYKPGMFGFLDENDRAVCEIFQCRDRKGYWHIILDDFARNMAELEKQYIHELQNAFEDVIDKNLEVDICSSQL